MGGCCAGIWRGLGVGGWGFCDVLHWNRIDGGDGDVGG